MGILSNNTKSPIPEPVQDMIDLYSEMIKTRRKIESGIGDKNHEIIRYDKLECKVNVMWAELSTLDQRQAVNLLVELGFMKEECARALIMFDGRVDMMGPIEPCLTIGPSKEK